MSKYKIISVDVNDQAEKTMENEMNKLSKEGYYFRGITCSGSVYRIVMEKA
jgi:hypothetical protein